MDLHSLTMYQACLMHSRAERVLKGIVSKHLERWGITRMEWLVLATVSEKSKNKQGHTMSEIANRLDVTLSQLNALVGRMNTAQYIEQENSVKDKRVKFVRITSKGKKLLSEVELKMRDKMRQWLRGIDYDSLALYMRTVQQLGVISNRDKSLSNDQL